MSERPHVPTHRDLLWPTLCAVRDIGDSGTNEEIAARVVAREGFSEDQLEISAPRSRGGLIEYRIAWARSCLKGMGLLDNSERGVWSTTELGRSAREDDLPDLYAIYVSSVREARRARKAEVGESGEGEPSEEDDAPSGGTWRDDLLKALKAMSPTPLSVCRGDCCGKRGSYR